MTPDGHGIGDEQHTNTEDTCIEGVKNQTRQLIGACKGQASRPYYRTNSTRTESTNQFDPALTAVI